MRQDPKEVSEFLRFAKKHGAILAAPPSGREDVPDLLYVPRRSSRRDDMLVTTYEEAVQWLEEFGHTIAAAERIAEVEQELEDAEVSAETEIALQESKLEALEDAVEAFKSLHPVGCCCLGCIYTEAAMKIKEAS